MEYQKNRLDLLARFKKEKVFSKQGEHQYQIENSFVFDSSDKFIKKLLVENKWKNITGQSKGFALKWIYMPKNYTFSELTQNQRINHFPHTHILTTKLGLKRTLMGERSAHLGWKGGYHGHFFPRSYDLSEQFDTFEKDFNRTAISNLTKKIMIAIELEANSLFHHLSKSVLWRKKRQERNWLKQARQLLDYNMMWESDASVLKSCRLRVNSKVFQALICYLSIVFTLDTDLCEEDFSIKEVKLLAKYSRNNPPYSDLGQHFGGNKQLARLPSLSALKLFFQLYKNCYQSWCWFKSDGLRNIWVVKTSDSSRGRSIFLVQSVEDAQSLNNGMRTIQKYIEDVWIHRPNPELKLSSTVRKLQNRKFDIRLWVVVKSFAPLEAFVYGEGYLRISQNKYQLLDISSEKSHLTNFSVNWSQEEDTQDSYLLVSEFLSFLQGNQIKSASLLKSEIYDVIAQTLYSAQLLTNNGDSRCFQLFGFDIILDGDLKPWLLQCNMSPACKERGILSNILEDMGAGLLSLAGVIDKHPSQKKWERITPIQYLAPIDKPKYLNKYSKENLVKQHYKSESTIKILKKSSSVLLADTNIINQCRINSLLPAISNSSFHSDDKALMITGTKIGKSSLAKLDCHYRLLEATVTIQRMVRKRFNPSKAPKPSLLCLKLLQVLAAISKSRKAKHLKSIRRFARKNKRNSK